MFITLEGIDGSGKSTQLKNIANFLETHEPSRFLVTREPGGWHGGEVLKKILLETENLDVATELLLFFADRNEHVRRVLLPAFEKGISVVCERYMDSTEAYQIGKNPASKRIIQNLAEFLSFPLPDITIFYAVSPEVALQRLRNRNALDTIEARGLDFLAEVAHRYDVLCRRNPSRIIRVDANRSSDVVWQETREILVERLLL